MTIPDPLPLRCIPVPPEATAVAGCNCGGLTYHRVQGNCDPPGSGCTIWQIPHEDAQAAIGDALDREQAFGAALNARLREALGSVTT